MKLILGFIVFIVLVAVTGGLYLLVRKADQKQTDRAWLNSLPGQINKLVKAVGEYLSKVFGSKTDATVEHPKTHSTPTAV